MRFRIAEVSKPLTSIAVGRLLERHKLNLDDEIQKYVPEFPEKQWPVHAPAADGARRGRSERCG